MDQPVMSLREAAVGVDQSRALTASSSRVNLSKFFVMSSQD
jgi:hypothetical protein